MSRREAAKRSGALSRVAAGFAGAAFAFAAIACDVVMPSMGQKPSVATVREKAVVPVGVERKKLAAPRLIVEVRKFEPPANDDDVVVEVLVEPKGGAARPAILGRFAMFPNAKFVAPTPADSQRFLFPLSPDNAKLIMETGAVAVKLQAVRGGGETASIELGAATLELPESGGTAPPKGG